VRFGNSKRTHIVSKEAGDMPGPGNYTDESNTFGKDGKKFTFSGKRGEKYSETPGPGTYDGDHAAVKDRDASVRIGSSKRGDIVSREL
jgi:hypothetical protein